MGYYIEIQNSDLVILNENKKTVLERWKKLNSSLYDYQKRGGSTDSISPQRWYSGMPIDYDKTSNTVEDILELLRFNYRVISNGNIEIKEFNGKEGQEALFFQTIADLIPSGQSIKWIGEDGIRSAWNFDGNRLNLGHTWDTFHVAEPEISKNPTALNPFKKKNKYNI